MIGLGFSPGHSGVNTQTRKPANKQNRSRISQKLQKWPEELRLQIWNLGDNVLMLTVIKPLLLFVSLHVRILTNAKKKKIKLFI